MKNYDKGIVEEIENGISDYDLNYDDCYYGSGYYTWEEEYCGCPEDSVEHIASCAWYEITIQRRLLDINSNKRK